MVGGGGGRRPNRGCRCCRIAPLCTLLVIVVISTFAALLHKKASLTAESSPIATTAEPHLTSTGQPRAIDFCGAEWALPSRVYQFHPPRDVVLPELDTILAATKPELARAWLSLNYSDERGVGPEIRSTAETIANLHRRSASCASINAVVGFAVFPLHTVVHFIRSFQDAASRGGCNVLHLFAEEKVPQSHFTDAGGRDVIFENYTEYVAALGDNIRDDAIGVEMRRTAVLKLWLDTLSAASQRAGLTAKGTYRRVLQVDTRDTVFMGDPFEFVEGTLETTDDRFASEYVFVVAEDVRWAADASKLNQMWVSGIAGEAFTRLVSDSVRFRGPSSAMRTLNSGLHVATPGALRDFLRVFALTQRFAPPGFGFDQGALQALFFGGFAVAKFPHSAFVLNPALTPMRHMYPLNGGNRFVRWGLNATHHTCDGHKYAVLHQLDRNPVEWRHAVKKYAVAPEDECVSISFWPSSESNDVVVDVTANRRQALVWLDGESSEGRRRVRDRAAQVVGPRWHAELQLEGQRWRTAARTATHNKSGDEPTCHSRIAVVVAVVAQEHQADVQALLLSFQRFATPRCHSLHLFGRQPRERFVMDRRPAAAEVAFHDCNHTVGPAQCAEQLLGSDELSLRRVNFVVVIRHAAMLFGNAPLFSSLTTTAMVAERREFVAAIRQRAFLAGTTNPLTAAMARMALRRDVVVLETEIRAVAQQSAAGRDGQAMPLLSAVADDLLYGTPRAVRDFFQLHQSVVGSAQKLAVGRTSRHVAFNFAFFFASAVADFPHALLVVDDLRGPFRTSFPALELPVLRERSSAISSRRRVIPRDDDDDAFAGAAAAAAAADVWLENCDGLPYDLIGRVPDVRTWAMLTRRYRPKWWADD